MKWIVNNTDVLERLIIATYLITNLKSCQYTEIFTVMSSTLTPISVSTYIKMDQVIINCVFG